ncbi:unnamed protein product [Lampetra planeri]
MEESPSWVRVARGKWNAARAAAAQPCELSADRARGGVDLARVSSRGRMCGVALRCARLPIVQDEATISSAEGPSLELALMRETFREQCHWEAIAALCLYQC